MDLERALRDDPDDPDLPLVYADALGNERGEHIILANLTAPTVEQQRRERELRRAAEQAMWQVSERDDRNGLARITWRRGFVDRIDVFDLYGGALTRLTALLERPELLRLRAIDLRCAWHSRDGSLGPAALGALLEKLPIRWLGVGAPDHVFDVEALSSLRERLPRITGLAIAGSNIDVRAINNVTDLELTGLGGAAYSEATVRALALLPLERLAIIGQPDVSILERFASIFDGEWSLRHFGLVGGDDAFNDAFVERLAKSKVLPKLASVGFTVNRFDASNRRLIENKTAFAHVGFFTGSRSGAWTSDWHDLAHLYEALGRAEDALVEFDALVTVADDATYWADIGMQLATLKRHDEALAAHDRAIAIDAKCARAWSGRACVLEDLERFAEAIAAWDARQAAGLADVHTWTHRAWTLMRLDRNDDALVALDKALELDPKHEWSLENRKKLSSVFAKAKRSLGKLLR